MSALFRNTCTYKYSIISFHAKVLIFYPIIIFFILRTEDSIMVFNIALNFFTLCFLELDLHKMLVIMHNILNSLYSVYFDFDKFLRCIREAKMKCLALSLMQAIHYLHLLPRGQCEANDHHPGTNADKSCWQGRKLKPAIHQQKKTGGIRS